MAEQWFVRVEGREYGPADLDDLEEWKREGRLLPQNYVRRRDETAWILASSVEELFPRVMEDATHGDAEEIVHRRSLGKIFAETFRVYRKGFPQFFALALLVALPSLALRISLAFVHYTEGAPITSTTRIASAIAVVMLGIVLVAWPIFIGGLQFATGDLAAGRTIRLGDILQRSINHWPRIARLCLFVYGSYFFWTALPLLAVATVASAPSLLAILIALIALSLQVYMTGRLFINFMFWQQSCTLGELDGPESLNESKALARGRTDVPRMQRPLWRGALLASLWLVLLLALAVAVELPFVMVRLNGITNFDDAFAMMQGVINAPAPDAMTIASDVISSLVHAALRPLLGIAFVILYFDARAK